MHKIDAADPALNDLRALCKRIGLTQAEFSDVLAVYASTEAKKELAFRAEMKNQLEKLGTNATMRVTALQTWLRGLVGDDLAKSMTAGLFSEKQVRGLEALANKFASQGAASFRSIADGRRRM
jgi:hypothetical protein